VLNAHVFAAALVLAFAGPAAIAQPVATGVTLPGSNPDFSGANAMAYIQDLCKPEYAGRFTGSAGATRAAEWIGRSFANWGLTPAGDDRGWLQFYPMLVTRQLERARLSLKDGEYGPIDYQEGNDFTVYMNSGSGKVTAEVLFAGFGISEPAMGRDDYAGIDARGKILLLYRGLPAGDQDWEFANERDYKMRCAAAHGATGVLMLDHGDWPIRGGTIHEEGYDAGLPALNISKKVARDLFNGSFRDLDTVLRDLPQKANSFLLHRTLRLDLHMERIEPGRGENVVAILPGADPLLREEYIVLGGHMDHNGVGRDGHLYPGADDNASGTAVVMELARLFAAQPERPKRSLLFVAFGGEEQGLRGSKYFAAHLPVPAGRIAAMFNFDMEGAGDGGAAMGGRNLLPEVFQTLTRSWSDSLLGKTRFGRSWGGSGSDHFHFIEQGMPAVYFSSTGAHPWYHEIEDQPQTLNPASLQSVGDRASALLHTLADWPEPLTLDNAGSGRFFLRHGDQFDLDCSALAWSAPDRGQAILTAQQLGLHFSALTLNPATTPCALFARLDSMEQWIGSQSQELIRFETAGSVDRAAGQGRLAVGIALRGTGTLKGSAATLRQLGRLGVNLLTIDDPSDPIFAGGQLSSAGRELLQTAQSANLLVHLDLADTTLVDAVMAGFQGRLFWSIGLDEAAANRAALQRRLNRDKTILILRCSAEDDPQQLLDLATSLPAGRLHISVLEGMDAEKQRAAYAFVAACHKLLTAEVGGEQSYKRMEKWFGRNLKKLLPQETGSRF